ncbi:glucose 1-dehydrogenase [Chitinasiproducens palmae]|uniref:Glucose 1-dehydrogenase n=1 Tax=Chitinasiproducens palmae TaxID=1770053 RepID=A0A1H2PP05_9BURK|nr:glucose 1-dehydrogenase [Chitinasiproducens palmae]SDV48442.1 glucose 1-dehydrogenase [Chitinasiproducens palmae]
MAKKLDGQVALVTGASSGIGAAVAEALGAAGAAVAVNYHSDEAGADRTVAAIAAAGGRAFACQADVGDPEAVQNLFAKTIEHFEAVDIVVANSGIQKDAAFVEMRLDDWRKVLETNLTGQFLTAQAAARTFLRQGQRDVSRALGKIICMSSVHEVIPWAGHANYAASKGGLGMLMRTLAQELSEQRIRINSIAPGAIRTPINRDAWETEEARERLLRLIPYGRIGEPSDIGNAAVWLASDDSDYVVGTTLFVDGGMCLYPGFRDNG